MIVLGFAVNLLMEIKANQDTHNTVFSFQWFFLKIDQKI